MKAVWMMLLGSMFVGGVALASPAFDEPTVVSIEALGRGGLYSLDIDYSLLENLSLGIGFSSWSLSTTDVNGIDTSVSVVFVPIYANVYLLGADGSHRGFVTAGVDVVNGSVSIGGSKVNNNHSGGALFTGGIGYEYRGSSGFLFRATPYILSGAGGSLGWFGLSFGYAF